MNQILFLCSGNYYRSRFAEMVFNHLALQQAVDWRAVSRGFRLHPQNVGPISQHALEALTILGIPLAEPPRHPQVASTADLESARRVIALKEAEHRPMMVHWFPEWAEQVEYWHIDDIDVAAPTVALHELHGRVAAMVATLAAR